MLETLNRWDWGSPRAWNNNYSLHKMMKVNKRSSKAAVPHKQYYMATEYKEQSAEAAMADE